MTSKQTGKVYEPSCSSYEGRSPIGDSEVRRKTEVAFPRHLQLRQGIFSPTIHHLPDGNPALRWVFHQRGPRIVYSTHLDNFVFGPPGDADKDQ